MAKNCYKPEDTGKFTNPPIYTQLQKFLRQFQIFCKKYLKSCRFKKRVRTGGWDCDNSATATGNGYFAGFVACYISATCYINLWKSQNVACYNSATCYKNCRKLTNVACYSNFTCYINSNNSLFSDMIKCCMVLKTIY